MLALYSMYSYTAQNGLIVRLKSLRGSLWIRRILVGCTLTVKDVSLTANLYLQRTVVFYCSIPKVLIPF